MIRFMGLGLLKSATRRERQNELKYSFLVDELETTI
jgi:hypothetical protein